MHSAAVGPGGAVVVDVVVDEVVVEVDVVLVVDVVVDVVVSTTVVVEGATVPDDPHAARVAAPSTARIIRTAASAPHS
ncbi:MAG: hypothetical protein QGG78_11000 [Acidimicrobiales bacterium]|nr:hypothetical protein [Acidimicrobiales bacterium]MDP7507525.1 hypothetical protein [Acidimicrobiales bacterium]